jgi:ADP-ribose pyrophosphatase YjhB (NUDIX family)
VFDAPGLLARGPWDPAAVEVTWRSEPFEPTRSATEQADRLLDGLRERGSPSHDGLAARLVSHRVQNGRLILEMQPIRWALRLLPQDAGQSMSALCVVRAADGSWLAGRRAGWLATWAGRWALGAGGAVEVDENPAATLERELAEEWSVRPERMTVEALIRVPSGMALLVGQAWLPEGASVTPDPEHDAYAWWPAEIDDWPAEADAPLRRMVALLTAS